MVPINDLPGVEEEEIPDDEVIELLVPLTNEINFDQEGYPLDLNVLPEFQKVFFKNVLRKAEFPRIYNKILQVAKQSSTHELTLNLFWVIFLLKFRSEDIDNLIKYRKGLSTKYSRWFFCLASPKDEISHVVIHIMAYVIFVLFYKTFKKEPSVFEFRFILDCFHLTFHELTGVMISNTCLQNNIEKIFTSKFFQFEGGLGNISPRDNNHSPNSMKSPKRHLPKQTASPIPEEFVKSFSGMDLLSRLDTLSKRGHTKSFSSSKLSGSPNILTHNVHIKKSSLPEIKQHSNNISQISEVSLTQNKSPRPGIFSHRNVFQTGVNISAEIIQPSKVLKTKFNLAQVSPPIASFMKNPSYSVPTLKRRIIERIEGKHETKVIPVSLAFLNPKAKDTSNEITQIDPVLGPLSSITYTRTGLLRKVDHQMEHDEDKLNKRYLNPMKHLHEILNSNCTPNFPRPNYRSFILNEGLSQSPMRSAYAPSIPKLEPRQSVPKIEVIPTSDNKPSLDPNTDSQIAPEALAPNNDQASRLSTQTNGRRDILLTLEKSPTFGKSTLGEAKGHSSKNLIPQSPGRKSILILKGRSMEDPSPSPNLKPVVKQEWEHFGLPPWEKDQVRFTVVEQNPPIQEEDTRTGNFPFPPAKAQGIRELPVYHDNRREYVKRYSNVVVQPTDVRIDQLTQNLLEKRNSLQRQMHHLVVKNSQKKPVT